VQILEPPLIPVVDMVTETEASGDEVEILEPPPIPMLDLITDSEDEVTSPSTPLLGDIVPMMTSEDSEREMELLRELDSVDLPREESRKAARREKGKRVMTWGKVQRTAKRTRCELRASLVRPSEKPKYFGFLNGREVDCTKRTGGFYESGLSLDRRE
jgi:hypothetical protein